MRTINENSKEVWFNDVLPTLAKRQKDVLSVIIQHGQMTVFECARIMKLFPHQISGRFTELTKKGALKVVNKVYHESRPNNVYEIFINNLEK